jgi:predicted transcriptional regulator
MVNRLEDKGAVRRVRKIGNAHIYEPTISRQAAHRRMIHDFLELFGGSAQPLMAHLLEAGKLTLDDVRALESAVGKTQGGSSSGKSKRKEDA